MPENQIIERLTKYLEKFNIQEYFTMKAKNLSKGNRQKIQFIISILHDPEFIILDEPFSGLDPVSVEELEKAIIELKSQGKTIIFSSHIMSHVENLCDEILIIDKGRTLLYENMSDLKTGYQLSNGAITNSLNDIFVDKVGGIDEQ